MDFEDIESEYFSPRVARIHEDRFSQANTQHRSRKSSRKRLRTARSSASLVIDQLKSVFRPRPGDLALPRVRARRNWRLEFLTGHLRDNNRHDRDEKCTAAMQGQRPRNLTPEVPRIYSIGLHPRSASILDDLSGSSSATRNLFKKRPNIVRSYQMAMIVRKCWIALSAPSSSLLAATSLQKYVNQQTATIFNRVSTACVPKLHQTPRSNQCYGERNRGDSLCDECTLNLSLNRTFSDDRFFKSDLNDLSLEKDQKRDRSCHVARKDAQIQTSGRTNWQRRKTRRRSERASEEALRSKHDNAKPIVRPSCGSGMILTDFHHSDGRNHTQERSRLPVRVLENKRAEYINKFKAVSRQIEEITATLRETCCGDENSLGGNSENRGTCSSLTLDDARINAKREFDENKHTVLPKPSTPKEEDSINIERITAQSECELRKNHHVRETSGVGYINEETPVVLRNTVVALPINHYNNSDIFVREFARAFTTGETTRYTNKASDSRRRAQCRVVKQISFDLDSTKQQDEAEEFSMEDGSFNEIYLRDDFGVSKDDEYAKVPIGDPDDSKGLRSRKMAEEKMGEREILVDIKRRIDRDFDDPSAEKRENDVEDVLAVSRKSSNCTNNHQFYDTTPRRTTRNDLGGTIEESRCTPLLMRRSPSDTADIQIRDSISAGTVSEYSNRDSTLSKYFSCTRFSSLISLTENEDELALAFEDQDTIARDLSYANLLHSDSNYYDLDLTSSVDYLNPESSRRNCSRSNEDTSFSHANLNSEFTMQGDPSARYRFSDECLIELINRTNNETELEDGDLEKKLCQRKVNVCRDDDHDNETKESAQLEERCTADSTFDSTSRSPRYISSIDSGVFVNSSLVDLYPRESSVDADGAPAAKRKTRCASRPNVSSSSLDSSSDGSCTTDDTLGRRVDEVVRDLTKNLILCERRAKTRLADMQKSSGTKEASHVHARWLDKDLEDAYCDYLSSARRSSEDERIVSISTPSLLSLSDSEMDERESRCRLCSPDNTDNEILNLFR